jgi:hypothetical protein
MKYVALFLGFALLAIGIASLVPQVSVDGQVFGLLPVSIDMALGLIAIGALGVMAGLSRTRELAPPVEANSHDMREWLPQ